MLFSYKAKQGPQEIINGTIEADNPDQAAAKILARGLTPLDIHAKQQARSRHREPISVKIFFLQKASRLDVALFTRQMCDLISAGVTVLEALYIVERQIKKPLLKEKVQKIINTVKDGGSFSKGLGQHPQTFSPLYVNMVRSGEVAGNLDVVLERLADFMEKDYEIRSQVKSSLIYPSLIVVIGIMTVFVLFTWVIPKISLIFDDLNQSLPWPTVLLLGLSDFFVRFWWAILALIGLAGIYLKKFRDTVAGKLWLDNLSLKVPVFGAFLKDVQLGRFARTLATLLENGVDIMTALNSVVLVIDNEVLRQELQQMTGQVTNGASLTEAVRGRQHFPETVVSMVAVGERSGRPHEGLHKLAVYYERQTKNFVKQTTSLIEPLLILFIGTIVGFVVIAMLMPIFRMNMIIQ